MSASLEYHEVPWRSIPKLIRHVPVQLEMCTLRCVSAHELISWLSNSTVV